jgi:hypothetical protein
MRTALAGAVFGLVFTASYALQRLWAAWLGEPATSAVLAFAHVPYFGRIALAVLHAIVVATVVGMAVRDPERWLGRVPVLVLVVVGAAASAMVLVP